MHQHAFHLLTNHKLANRWPNFLCYFCFAGIICARNEQPAASSSISQFIQLHDCEFRLKKCTCSLFPVIIDKRPPAYQSRNIHLRCDPAAVEELSAVLSKDGECFCDWTPVSCCKCSSACVLFRPRPSVERHKSQHNDYSSATFLRQGAQKKFSEVQEKKKSCRPLHSPPQVRGRNTLFYRQCNRLHPLSSNSILYSHVETQLL